MKTARPITSRLLAPSILLAPSLATATLVYTDVGAVRSENFDSLPNSGTPSWADNSTLQGWYFLNPAGQTPSTLGISSGAGPDQDRPLSLGSSGATDRALGSQNSNNAATIYFGVQWTNQTAIALSEFSLAYTGEQWRMISNEPADGLTLEYQIFAAGSGGLSIAGGWTAVPELAFVAPRTTTGSSSALNGNQTANRVALSHTVAGISWDVGQELWLRWADINPVSSPTTGTQRAVVGIDDLSFSAVPEPGAGLLTMLGCAGLLGALRRRRLAA
jgi:hypothetical protein